MANDFPWPTHHHELLRAGCTLETFAWALEQAMLGLPHPAGLPSPVYIRWHALRADAHHTAAMVRRLLEQITEEIRRTSLPLEDDQ